MQNTDEIYSYIAANVKIYRKIRGLSIKELSQKTDISEYILKRLEGNKFRRLTYDMYLRIVDTLDIDPDSLVAPCFDEA